MKSNAKKLSKNKRRSSKCNSETDKNDLSISQIEYNVSDKKIDNKTEPDQYIAAGAKNSYHGTDYNLKLLMYFAWKIHLDLKENPSKIRDKENFYLATEMKEAGKFDDVVLRYWKNGRVNYRLLQAKHKQFVTNKTLIKASDLVSDDIFGLKIYCRSYLDILKINSFTDGVIEDVIICTNTEFDFNSDDKKYNLFQHLKEIHTPDMFFCLKGKRYRFDFDGDNQKRKIIVNLLKSDNKDKENSENKINDFLNKLVFAVGQPSTDELTMELDKSIKDEFKITNNVIFNMFYNYMSTWVQSYEKNENDIKASFLTYNMVKSIFDNAEGIIASLKMNDVYKNEIQELGIKFKEDSEIMEAIQKFFFSKKKILLIYQNNLLFSMIKLCHILENVNLKCDNFIFISTKDLLVQSNAKENLIKAFEISTVDHLIVKIDDETEINYKLMELFKICFQILFQHQNKKIIFVLKSTEKNMDEFLNEVIKADKLVRLYDNDNNTLYDLDQDSKTKVLQKKILFQCKELNLDSLIENDDLEKLVTGEILLKILKNEKIKIGHDLQDLNEVQNYYIERSLDRRFKSKESKIENIPNYSHKQPVDLEDKIFFISGEPGIGKTTFLSQLAIRIKTSHPDWWIIKISLLDYTDELDDWDKENTREFLFQIIKFDSLLEKNIFESRLDKLGKIALFFDGFDEISPTYKDKVVKIFEFLKLKNVEKLYITSRLHMQKFLEHKLCVCAYQLKPFFEEDQREFLIKFWKSSLPVADSENLTNVVDSVLKLNVFGETIPKFSSNFLSTPLHIKMFAEICNEFVTVHNIQPGLPKRLRLLNLYEMFIEKKFKIFCKEKMKMSMTNEASKLSLESVKENTIRKLKKISLMYLFPKEMYKILPKKKDINLNEDILRVGIITKIKKNKVDFIHRTFAEYFAALWLADKENWKCNNVKNFLKKNIFNYENKTLRYFFDYMLCTNKGHKAEINIAILNMEFFTQFSWDTYGKKCLYWTDQAGRSPLHLAASYGHKRIVDYLINNDAVVDFKDEIFDWTPLAYAGSSGNWDAAKLILKKKGIFNSVFKNNKITCKPKASISLLYMAIKNNNVEFVKVLTQENIDLNVKNKYGKSPLHEAVHCNNIEIIDCLINSGANILSVDKFKRTPLHIAVYDANLIIVIKLITYLKFNNKTIILSKLMFSTDRSGNTAFCVAIHRGNLEIAQYLAKNLSNEDLIKINNYPNKNGSIPLCLAFLNYSKEAVEYLISIGANISVRDNKNRNILHKVVYKNKLEIVQHIIEYVKTSSPQNISKLLLAIDNNGNTPLQIAIDKGNVDMVQYLRGGVENSINLT